MPFPKLSFIKKKKRPRNKGVKSKIKDYKTPKEKIEKMNKIETSKVSDIMTSSLVAVSLNDNLKKVSDIFIKNHISGAPVVAKGFFVGEISRSDILNIVKKDRLEDLAERDKNVLRGVKVIEVMKRPICVSSEELIENCTKKMEKCKIKRLIVIDDNNRMVGIVTDRDLVKISPKEKVKNMISTKIDEILKLLESGPKDLIQISKSLEIPVNLVEQWGRILEEQNLIEVSYPVMGSPVFRLKPKVQAS